MTKKKIIIFTSLLLSLVAEILIIFIIYINKTKITPLYEPAIQMWVSAIMNGFSALSLATAIYFIKNKKIRSHIKFIHISLFFSFLFLINYIFYHLSVAHVLFTNPEYRPFYLCLLASHLVCSFIGLPMIILTYFLGLFNYLSDHKKIAKITFFMWEYISVTGVLIVVMLKYFNS